MVFLIEKGIVIGTPSYMI